MDRDVQAGVTDRLPAGAEAARVAELGEDRDRGQLTDAVKAHQRATSGLAARVATQLARDRRRLGIERVDHRQRDRDLFACRIRQRETLKPPAVRGGQKPGLLRVPMVIEHRMDALLPLTALIDQRVTQPHPRAQIEQVLGRDVGLGQPTAHQQLPQTPRVAAVGLGPPLVALQRARLGRLGQMRFSTDGEELLDHEPPPGRGLQRHLEPLTGKPRQEAPNTGPVGRITRARETSPVSVSSHSAVICARC